MRSPPRLGLLLVIVARLSAPCMLACAAPSKKPSARTTAGEVLPTNSYVVTSVMIALPRDRLSELEGASDRELEQVGTLYSGSTAMLQVEAARVEMPRIAPYEPSADPLANTTQQLHVSFSRAPVESGSPHLDVHIESSAEFGQVAVNGVLAPDGKRFIVDTGVEHEGKTLAVAISAHAVRTREDLRRLYELKKAAAASN